MIKKLRFSVFMGVLLMCLMPLTAGAYFIDTLYANPTDDPDGYTSSYAGVAVEDFNDATLLWNWSGNRQIVSDSVPGQYAAPFGKTYADTTPYLSVPLNFASASTATVTGFGTANYLGLWWGSIDDYNTLTFYYDNAKVLSVTGAEVITLGATFGNQIALGSNHYVNFYDLPAFDTIALSSSQYAFEADNVAVGNVPIPAAIWLLASGLIGLVGIRRRFKK